MLGDGQYPRPGGVSRDALHSGGAMGGWFTIMVKGRHLCKPFTSTNSRLDGLPGCPVRSLVGSLCKLVASLLVTAPQTGVGSETTSRHKAYGNVIGLVAHHAQRSPRPKRRHATRRMETLWPVRCWGSRTARPKRRHATRRMETISARSTSQSWLSETTSRHKAYGNWSAQGGRPRLRCPGSETTSRHKAYGNVRPGVLVDRGLGVRNDGTPQGVWKQRVVLAPGLVVVVRNDVTPQGVWKPGGVLPQERRRVVVRNDVTP